MRGARVVSGAGSARFAAALTRAFGAASTRALAAALAGAFAFTSAACGSGGADAPLHRERASGRDGECKAPERPRAYFYPATDRTHYGPDVPSTDGCELLVADHLFCCPDAPRPTDR